MTKIGGGGPPKPRATPKTEPPADLETKEGVKQFRDAAGAGVPKQVVDSFERAAPALAAKLQKLDGPALARELNFTNSDLALLARTFATVVRNNPSADRMMRAKLFAKAILKKKGAPKRGKWAELLDDENDAYDERDRTALEELYEMLAEQLNSTPVFAQLVDEVTEGARKIR